MLTILALKHRTRTHVSLPKLPSEGDYVPCEADNIKVMGCSEDEYEQQSPASVLFPGGSDELSGVGSVLAICLCGLGHERSLAAADA